MIPKLYNKELEELKVFRLSTFGFGIATINSLVSMSKKSITYKTVMLGSASLFGYLFCENISKYYDSSTFIDNCKINNSNITTEKTKTELLDEIESQQMSYSEINNVIDQNITIEKHNNTIMLVSKEIEDEYHFKYLNAEIMNNIPEDIAKCMLKSKNVYNTHGLNCKINLNIWDLIYAQIKD